MQKVVNFRRQKREMMQPRPDAVEEHDVVRIAFALQKYTAQLAARRRDVFCQHEAERHVELAGLAHLRRLDLKVIEPQRAAAFVLAEARDHARHHRHAGAEFQRRADRIGDVQRAGPGVGF